MYLSRLCGTYSQIKEFLHLRVFVAGIFTMLPFSFMLMVVTKYEWRHYFHSGTNARFAQVHGHDADGHENVPGVDYVQIPAFDCLDDVEGVPHIHVYDVRLKAITML